MKMEILQLIACLLVPLAVSRRVHGFSPPPSDHHSLQKQASWTDGGDQGQATWSLRLWRL